MAESWDTIMAIDNAARRVRSDAYYVNRFAIRVLLLLEKDNDELEVHGVQIRGAGFFFFRLYLYSI